MQAIANGIMVGGVYALISVGLTLIFGVMSVTNFAQAEFLMLGMYGSFLASVHLGVDPLLSAVFVGAAVFAIGMLVERGLIEPIIKAPPLAQIMVTIGLSIVLQNGAALVFGNDFHSARTPYQMSLLHVGPLELSLPYLYAFLYAMACVLALQWFLTRTEFGRAVRATAQNRDAAVLMGIAPRRVFMVAFGLGVGLAGLAGAVILPYTTTFPTVGQQYVLIMFTVVVLGGLGSVRGTMIAGLVVGVVQAVSTVYLSTQFQNLVVFLIFFLALVAVQGRVVSRVRARFLSRA